MFCAGALLLSACAGDDPEAGTTPGPDQSSSPETPPEGSEAPTGEEAQAEEAANQIPDPEAMPVERDEELGAYGSAQEACSAIEGTVDGVEEDIEDGLEDAEEIDETYQLVEQTYLHVPEVLREPLEQILVELTPGEDEDGEPVPAEPDEDTVLSALEEVEGWVDESCQDLDEEDEDAEQDGAEDDGAQDEDDDAEAQQD